MTPRHKIPEGSSVSYTDEEGGEWAAVVIQHLERGRYDIRLADAQGHEKVVATEDQLEQW